MLKQKLEPHRPSMLTLDRDNQNYQIYIISLNLNGDNKELLQTKLCSCFGQFQKKTYNH